MRSLPIDDLVLIARHVAGGEACCAQQVASIVRLKAAGHDTGQDEVVLAFQRQSLLLMRAHQNLLEAACEIG